MKKVLITGASGDLGSSIATKIASELKQDALLILHYNGNYKRADALSKQLSKKYGCKTEIRKANLSNLTETEELCKQIINEHGSIDILINNAAIVLDADLSERTTEMFTNTINCNLISPFILSKQLGLLMNKKGKGKIINIASTNGIDYNSPYSLDYDASKAGLISLSKNLAMLLPNVNVNCVAPHWMNTQMNNDLEKEFLQEEANKTIKGRFAETDEVAEFVWFLLSDKADYLTGQLYSFGSYKY